MSDLIYTSRFKYDVSNPYEKGTELYRRRQRQIIVEQLSQGRGQEVQAKYFCINRYLELKDHNARIYVKSFKRKYLEERENYFNDFEGGKGEIGVRVRKLSESRGWECFFMEMGNDEGYFVFDKEYTLMLHVSMPIYGRYTIRSHDKGLLEEVYKELELEPHGRPTKEIIRVIMGATGLVEKTYPMDDEEVFLDEELYPFVNAEDTPFKNVESLISGYLESTSPALILIGQPGTGKTSLVRHLALKTKLVKFFDDPAIFTEGRVKDVGGRILSMGKRDMCVFEEIDSVLKPRKSGPNVLINTMLTSCSGLIKTKGKVVIVSNLDSVTSIDPALLRSARCFAVINFRKLTQEEADKACDKVGKPRLTGRKEYMLSEVFNGLSAYCPEDNKVGFC